MLPTIQIKKLSSLPSIPKIQFRVLHKIDKFCFQSCLSLLLAKNGKDKTNTEKQDTETD